MSQIDRRSFLKLGGAGLFGITFTPLLGGCDGTVDPPVNREGFVPFITPTSQFYVQHGGRDTIAGWSMPDVSRQTWALELSGQGVNTPMTVDWSQMQAAITDGKARRMLKTMRCILDSHLRPGATGWTGNAVWTGVPLRYFLDQTGLDRDATKRLVFSGYDNFSHNITLARYGDADLGAMEPLLVYEMNDEPLRREHGGPVRLLLLDTYGFKNIKWLKRVRASLFDMPTGTYHSEGFVDDGVIRVASRSENFSEAIRLKHGDIEVTGFALSGYDAISHVEISIDDNPFQRASLEAIESVLNGVPVRPDVLQLQDKGAYPYRGVWTKWRFRWSATKGSHTVAIRATDKAGNTQLDEDFDLQDGLSGVVRYNVTVE